MAQPDPDALEQRAREALTGTVPQLIAAARPESASQIIKDADEEYKQSDIEDGHGVCPTNPVTRSGRPAAPIWRPNTD